MGFEFFKNWAEMFFFVLMVIGIIINLSLPSAVVSYIVILVCGMFAGRIIYFRKGSLKSAYYIIILGFFIGYTISARYGDRKIITVLFVIGAVLSYYLYDKKVLKDVIS